MTRKVGVIGMGHVGSTVANYIINGGFTDDIVLIDTNELKVNADATDFTDALANLPFHTKITVNDYDALKDADVIISAVGKISLQKDNPKHDRFVELPFTKQAVKDVSAKIKASGFNGILIDITNPCDVITTMYQKYTGLPKKHVMGTGTLLDSSRMKRAVAQELNIDPRSVDGYNLGEHGNSQFTAWSAVRVLGHPITKVAKERNIDLTELDEIAKPVLHRLPWQAVHQLRDCVSRSEISPHHHERRHTELPVSNWHEEYNTYLSYPAIVGRDGIEEQVHLDLTDEEKEKLAESANYIRTRFEDTVASLGD